MDKKIIALGVVVLASVSSAFASVGDYKETSCAQDYFTANNCTACFDGGNVTVGQKIGGLYDTWTNKNSDEQVIYKDEQTFPSMKATSEGTVFGSNPVDAATFWKYGADVIWVDSNTGSGKQEFVLEAGKSAKFLEADLGASYAMEKTDKKAGEVVGVLAFPLSYHNLDKDGNEGKRTTHIECVAYKSNAAVAKVAPVVVAKPAPVIPKEVTKVKTGPESIVIIALAFLIAAGVMAIRRRNS